MVTCEPRPWRGRSGKGRLGCIVPVVLLGIGLYLGFPVGSAYLDYWKLKDEIKTLARHASGLDDATIQRRVLDRIRALRLPDEAVRNLQVRRQTRQILISTSYDVVFDLKVTRYTHRFTPQARHPL